jgi:hypothetical protein
VARFDDDGAALRLLKNARRYLADLPPTLDSDYPNMWSPDIGVMTPDELRDFAESVIPVRTMWAVALTLNKTFHFVDGYLGAMSTGNPYVLFAMTRAQVELLAAVYRVAETIEAAAVRSSDPSSVESVDRSLVGFLYGNRRQLFENLSEAGYVPPDVPTTARDDFEAKNVITLVQRSQRDPRFDGVLTDYERLCEFLHPNAFGNMALMELLPDHGVRIHRSGERVMTVAVRNTLSAMTKWTDATISLVNSIKFPFGRPNVQLRE